ncbi:MAG: cytochrome P450 [Pseudomonadota bacterium]
MTGDLPFLDITAPGFSTRGADMQAARAAHFAARTPLGLAILRHREVGLLLRDRRLRQGSHAWPQKTGITGSFAAFWQRSIISQEGASHRALRNVALKALTHERINSLRPAFTAHAQVLLDALPSPCEFITDFTEPFAGRAITTLLGLPEMQASALAHDASRLGLAMGLDNHRHLDVFNGATDRLMALADHLIDRAEDGQDRTGLVAGMLAAAQDTDLDRQALKDLIVIAIFGGVDTTRAQLGFAACLFADHPDQWDALRRDPALIPQAIEEVIRTRPTTTWSSREATEDITFQDLMIPKGTLLHLWVHASATDPALGPSSGFDVTALRKSHFGFGGGAHHCLGAAVARTDMACALKVLVAHVARFEYTGTPQFHPDSGNTSPTELPMSLRRQ